MREADRQLMRLLSVKSGPSDFSRELLIYERVKEGTPCDAIPFGVKGVLANDLGKLWAYAVSK